MSLKPLVSSNLLLPVFFQSKVLAITPEGLQRISEANIKHGRQTKPKLAAQRHAAQVGHRVMGELKKLERQLEDAGLMPDGD